MRPEYWWQTGVVYQIYPRSYQDSNDDGIGDLQGIIDRLDYVKSLGVDAIWLSPIFRSPMVDFGYDVADYRDIDPIFGTMEEFDRLLEEVHKRGLKLLLDFVPNHSSDQHPWFLESRSSRDNPRRDWYIWADPAEDGGPPNNWLSFFGGSAWTLDEKTGQYYLHLFAPEQPDLNWRNPDVEAAMLDNLRFWLDKGVDGFRIDVIWTLMKDPQLRDEPPNPEWDGGDPFGQHLHTRTQNLPEVHDVICKMRGLLDRYDERVMVGEIYLPLSELMTYYGTDQPECHLPFNFHLLLAEWDAKSVARLIDDYEAALPEGAWPNWVLGNHDQPRVATRLGQRQARVAQMLLLTLRGTPTIYYGDEIGMEDGDIPPERIQDPPALNQPDIEAIYVRDRARTPMQWDASAHAGFCEPEVEPWLPVAAGYEQRNVARQEEDRASMLALFRRLTELRRAEPALYGGRYRAADSGNAGVVAYVREPHSASEGSAFLAVLNFEAQEQTVDLTAIAPEAEIVCTTDMETTGSVKLGDLRLAPDQGLLLRLPGKE